MAAHDSPRRPAPGRDDADPTAPLLQPAATDGENEQSLTDKRKGLLQSLREFYDKNFGLFLVFLAQFFASTMIMTTKLLETGFETKFHALQIIFVRMFSTAIIGSLWMMYKAVPGFPFGPRGVRGLLVIRGTAGTIGLFGLYYSLSYLDMSDATVITFLVPTLTAFVCWVALHEPFTVKEALAGLLAFGGVLFIARPPYLFPSQDGDDRRTCSPEKASPAERAMAIACAILGAFAAATAYATIRVIGKRAHSLVSVNYFAVLGSVSSFAIIMIHPDLQFEIPHTVTQWLLLVFIGISGFLLQVLLTEGLQREKAGRATNLIYTQMIWALVFERIVWGTTPPITSFIGSGLIISGAVWISLQKKAPETPKGQTADEENRTPGTGEQHSRS
uniref:EamA domain-containing protein n=1 Tax=Bionectria ochroleuca TaxID=29856 RepID=A0A8H7NH63_BIOOC